MEQRFPQALENRLMEMVEKLRSFMIETEFVYKICDMPAKEAADPALDTSGWLPLTNRQLKRDQGVTWVRATVTVPEFCMDVPVAGSQLRVMAENGSAMFAPLDLYIDGKLSLTERSWMDFKCPEGIVTQNAVPGEKHTVAFRFDLNEKCYWLNNVTLQVICDRVEDNAKHICSIIEELKYMEGYEGTAPLLDKAYALLDKAVSTGLVAQVREAEEESRALFEGYREQVKQKRVYLVGHAHIDMNWFWSMEETRDIVKRDFTTMTNLMEKYPDFKFSQSQCATYEIAEQRCPEVFKKMQAFERDNRWDVTASTWVEGDINMAQGESIVRHVLYSKDYLSTRFEKTPHIMWCPDTFGHPATIPQILKKSGLNYYYHTRCGLGVGSHEDKGFRFLEDSQHTPVYWWTGLDGSRVLVCNTVYNRTIDTRGLLRASRRMESFGVDKAMLTYGVGDHGGGPTIRDIEWVNTVRKFPTVPDIYFSTTEEYYAAIEQGGYTLPERVGEMNFVFDGCYTTHADIKRENRLCEEGLMAVEKLYAIAGKYGVAYPYEQLKDLWKRTLFNQFHDILDGSGVKDTYVFTMEEAEKVLLGVKELTDKAMRALSAHFGAQGAKAYLIYNPSGFERSETVSIPVDAGAQYQASDTQGNCLRCQTDGGVARVFVEDIPASGVKVICLKEDKAAPAKGHITQQGKYYYINTPLYEIEICKDNGQITTLYDVKQDWYVVRREEIGWRLKKGVLNSLQIHMEEPTEMSGWTIGNVRTIHNLLSGAKSEIICDGESESRIRFEHHFGNSTIWQDIVVHPEQAQIRFETKVDWQEWGDFDRDAPMLRAYFAPAVKNHDAVYEIPFGTISRPADDNEYPALNWVDINDEAHGFALLNDCKHGHKCRGNAMEMTLIRSGWLPDQKSDTGMHEFTYAILPHAGDWQTGKVLAAGQAINQPVCVSRAHGGQSADYSLITCQGAVLSNLKAAESSSGLIARVYNPTNTTVKAVLTLGFDAKSVEFTDLLEKETLGSVALKGRQIQIQLNAFEIASLKID